jgi:Zn-dependent protease
LFGKRITLFKLFGFNVRIDLSWLIIALLITWSLAKGVFPQEYQNLSTSTYWWMGILGALGLFISIIVHEMSHSLVARRYGLPIKGITLFIFGGVAEMHNEPAEPKAEFMMAIAGPIASIIIGLVFLATRYVGVLNGWPDPYLGVVQYLALINFILAGFNLIPAFPLDGGRVLRSALWKWKNDLKQATRIASKSGAIFGAILMGLGILQFFTGNLVGGIWWFLIGTFLRNASQMSYKQMLYRKVLEGEKVKHFMREDPISVNPDVTLDEFVNDYIYHYHFKMFPVVENSKLVGCVTSKQVKDIPKQEWNQRKVKDILKSCQSDNTIDVDTDATEALSIMQQSDNTRLMVTKDNKLMGVLSIKDMLNSLSMKVDLEGDDIG